MQPLCHSYAAGCVQGKLSNAWAAEVALEWTQGFSLCPPPSSVFLKNALNALAFPWAVDYAEFRPLGASPYQDSPHILRETMALSNASQEAPPAYLPLSRANRPILRLLGSDRSFPQSNQEDLCAWHISGFVIFFSAQTVTVIENLVTLRKASIFLKQQSLAGTGTKAMLTLACS